MRFTANFSRACIERGIPFAIEPNHWLISIADKDAEPAAVVNPFDRILFLHFDDEEDSHNPNAMTEKDLADIVSFINEARQHDASVWVNCHAGICRSGAIVEVLEMLGWTVADHWMVNKRIPNRLVLQSLRRCFPEIRQSWEE